MNAFTHLFSGGLLAPLMVNLLLQVTLVTAAVLMAIHTLLRHRPALRHGVIRCAFIYLLLSPVLSLIATRVGAPLISVPLPSSVSHVAEFRTTPAHSVPVDPSLVPPAAVCTAAVPEPPAPVPAESANEVSGAIASAPVAIESAAPNVPAQPLPAALSEDGIALNASAPPPATWPLTPNAQRLTPDVIAAFLVLIWGIGIVAASIRFAWGRLQIMQLRSTMRPLDVSALQEVLAEVRTVLDAWLLPPMFTSSCVTGPLVLGVRRPVVVLPQGLTQQLTAGELRDVLIHECAHVLSGHPLEGLLQRVVSILLWPHPLVHFLGRELARAREEVCDNFVLDCTVATDYARTLLTMAEGAHGWRPASSLTLLPLRFCLEQRIAGLLDPGRDLGTRTPRWQLGSALAVCLLLGTTIGVHGQSAQGPVPPPTAPPSPSAPAAVPAAPAPVMPPYPVTLPTPVAPSAVPAMPAPVTLPVPSAPAAVPASPVPVTPQDPAQATTPRLPIPTQAPVTPPVPAADPTLSTPGKPAAPRLPESAPHAPATNPADPAPQQSTPDTAPGTPAVSPALPAPQTGTPVPTSGASPTTPALPASQAPISVPVPGAPAVSPALPASQSLTPAPVPPRTSLRSPRLDPPTPAGPQIDGRLVTLKLSNTTLGAALAALMEWAHVSYTLDSQLSDDRIGAIRLERVPFRVALETVLRAGVRPVTYELENNIYRIMPKESTEVGPETRAPSAEIGRLKMTPKAGANRISIDFDNADLYAALKLMCNRVGVQYTLAPSLRTVKITARLTDIPFRNALEMVLRNSGRPIIYRVIDGVYNIIPKTEEVAASSHR